MRIASVTAGAAGMFCGSCLRDNTLAAALVAKGHECLLIPTFTPLTLDEPDQSIGQVFLGGVNIYLDEFTLFRWIPRWARQWLDRPKILRLASRFSGIENYERLGTLAISMLRGEHGRQRIAFEELNQFLAEYRPDVVLLTNVLLSAVAPLISKQVGAPVVATLQGDDIFLDALKPAHREEAKLLIRTNGQSINGYIATSAYYADHMAEYLNLDRDRIDVVYPGVSLKHHVASKPKPKDLPIIGYFARIAPEKGLHHLVEAFIRLRKQHAILARLKVSGWLGPQYRRYFQECMDRIRSAGLEEFVEHTPVSSMREKVAFYRSLDVFSVPTDYREPKALYVLEALANGVPVVLPRHGAVTELVNETGGGRLVEPNNTDALVQALAELLSDPEGRRKLGEAGQLAVRDLFNAERMATATVAALQKFMGSPA